MRTALVLLGLLALASIGGSLVPQIPNSPDRVIRFRVEHPAWGALFERLGLFDVFGSWWFGLIAALLFVSLVTCLVPRTRAAVRALRARPVHAREIDSFPQYEERVVAAAPAAALDRSHRVLRRRLFRVDRAEGGLAAEKGLAREAGSLVFHWSFLLLLAGAIWGKGTGYSGYAVISEGEAWTDAAANYDGRVRAGRFFDGDFSGIGVRLLDFEAAVGDAGTFMDFRCDVELIDPDGEVVRRATVRVNHPVSFGGVRIYQADFGWAPVLRVTEDGTVVRDGPIPLAPAPASEGPRYALPWYGFVKLPSTEPGQDVAVSLELWNDFEAFVASQRSGTPVSSTRVFSPYVRYTVYRGTLTDLSQRGLDTTLMEPVARGSFFGGQTKDLLTGEEAEPGPGRLTIAFSDLRQYAVLQVARDRGVGVVLAAAILVLVGLLPALYTSRRKVWVRAETDGDGTVLKVGGFALQRKAHFEEEFARLVDEIARAAGGVR
jgi:cytochrome c biogenesis protein